jgi:hypothetical protein
MRNWCLGTQLVEVTCCFHPKNTMVFSTPFLKKNRCFRALLGVLLLASASLARADSIFVQSVDLTPRDGEYYLNASFNIGLTPTAQEALNRGVALHFLVEFALIYPRWYTLYFWNKRLVELQQTYRLSFNALTRQYRLSYGVLHQTFYSLENALLVLGSLSDQPVFEESLIDEDRVYEAQLRMRLDTARLPKPFQIDALGSDNWDVTSSWFRWTITR